MKLIIDISELTYDCYKDYVKRHVACLAETIIVDGTPIPTGEWIIYNYPAHECVYCSKCKAEYYEDDLRLGGNDFPDFCPNCGARMRKEADNGQMDP